MPLKDSNQDQFLFQFAMILVVRHTITHSKAREEIEDNLDDEEKYKIFYRLLKQNRDFLGITAAPPSAYLSKSMTFSASEVQVLAIKNQFLQELSQLELTEEETNHALPDGLQKVGPLTLFEQCLKCLNDNQENFDEPSIIEINNTLAKLDRKLPFSENEKIFSEHQVTQFGSFESITHADEILLLILNARDNNNLPGVIDKGTGNNLLHIAARYGTPELVATLIDQYKFNIDATNKNGHTILHSAILGNNLPVVEYLLKTVETKHLINSAAKNDKSILPPLHYALQLERTAIAKRLIADPAIDPNETDHDARTALIKLIANHSKNYEIISLLVQDEKVDLNSQDRTGFTALHYLAHVRHLTDADIAIAKEIIATKRIDINKMRADDIKTTALHIAAQHGNTAMVSLLLESGADKDLQNDSSDTAYLLAVRYNHPDIMALLNPVIIPDAKHSSNDDPLIILQETIENNEEEDKKALFAAIQGSALTALNSLLSRRTPEQIKKLINSSNANGITPLHAALTINSSEMVNYLLDNDADLFAKNTTGKTALAVICDDENKKHYLEHSKVLPHLPFKYPFALGLSLCLLGYLITVILIMTLSIHLAPLVAPLAFILPFIPIPLFCIPRKYFHAVADGFKAAGQAIRNCFTGEWHNEKAETIASNNVSNTEKHNSTSMQTAKCTNTSSNSLLPPIDFGLQPRGEGFFNNNNNSVPASAGYDLPTNSPS